ncbi:MAG: XdhC family protein [Actinomycetota bacterium]|nr:XdhC family protein [Actinomycetota bacterium]
MNRELLELAADLSSRHQPFLTATVVWARGPSSGKRGSTAIIQPDGSVIGWIGGACAEPVVKREALEALEDGKSRLLFLGTDEDIKSAARPDVTTVPISCTSEGAMEVFLEPALPQPHLVIVGSTPAVATFAELASAIDWRVEVVESDVMPRDVGTGTAIVIATQGHYDEPALEAALRTDAGYIGLVASSKRSETVLGYLRDRGVSEDQLERVAAPAGLDLGHLSHREIGVAILAELVKRRAGGDLNWTTPVLELHMAIDPVCNMEVEVATARFISEHDGETFYFCAPGCKASFDKSPAEFVGV